MRPSEFLASSVEDKLYMTAYMQTYYEMRAVEDYELEKKLAEQRRRGSRQ